MTLSISVLHTGHSFEMSLNFAVQYRQNVCAQGTRRLEHLEAYDSVIVKLNKNSIPSR